jgi:hypothetical protein
MPRFGSFTDHTTITVHSRSSIHRQLPRTSSVAGSVRPRLGRRGSGWISPKTLPTMEPSPYRGVLPRLAQNCIWQHGCRYGLWSNTCQPTGEKNFYSWKSFLSSSSRSSSRAAWTPPSSLRAECRRLAPRAAVAHLHRSVTSGSPRHPRSTCACVSLATHARAALRRQPSSSGSPHFRWATPLSNFGTRCSSRIRISLLFLGF